MQQFFKRLVGSSAVEDPADMAPRSSARTTFSIFAALLLSSNCHATSSLYDLSVFDIEGRPVSLQKYAGTVSNMRLFRLARPVQTGRFNRRRCMTLLYLGPNLTSAAISAFLPCMSTVVSQKALQGVWEFDTSMYVEYISDIKKASLCFVYGIGSANNGEAE